MVQSTNMYRIYIHNNSLVFVISLMVSIFCLTIFLFELSRPGATLTILVSPLGITPIALFGVMSCLVLVLGASDRISGTTISVTLDSVSVRHWPIPWPRGKHVHISNVGEIVTKEIWGSNLRFLARIGIAPKESKKMFQVKIPTEFGKTLLKVRGFSSRDAAGHLASRIEETLTISRSASGSISQP